MHWFSKCEREEYHSLRQSARHRETERERVEGEQRTAMLICKERWCAHQLVARALVVASLRTTVLVQKGTVE